MSDYQENPSLDDVPQEDVAGQNQPDTLSDADRKGYLSKIKKRNKYLLMNLNEEERENIGRKIIELYNDALPEHLEICKKVDEWDEVSRLLRKDIIGSDGNLPNYRLPISLVAQEVIHANVMNVFFSPKDIMRVLPTSADDISKTDAIATFGNWSMKNELDIFTKVDQLFHYSSKTGEGVVQMDWRKEYGVDIKRTPLLDKDGNVRYDEETNEQLYHEEEVAKLIYNAPNMDVFSRKDYIQPKGARMGVKPPWEGRILRIDYDTFMSDELIGKYYDKSTEYILSWPQEKEAKVQKQNVDGKDIPVGKWEEDFLLFTGRLRINVIEEELNEAQEIEAYELEDEFIAVVHIQTKQLCSIRKNNLPMKMRPFIVDYFMPDDEGRRCASGIYENMDSMQKCYDILFNEFIYGVSLSNKTVIFFSPTSGMRDEKFKIEMGYAYPTSDPNAVKIFNFPQPNTSIEFALQLVQQWCQFLFGISDYAAGMDSKVDPTAPAKKAEIIVEQGNVRLNMIVKRKLNTLKEIFKFWFLLYRDNMPKNKFMRITGEGENKDPWKFEPIKSEDFQLKSIPDFELTGNILNSNKQLEIQKKVSVYQMLVQNPFFMPNTQQGLLALKMLTKWLIEGADDPGLSRMLPDIENEGILYTPEEEEASMLQGNDIIPLEDEDHLKHLKSHMNMMKDTNYPKEAKMLLQKHIDATVEMLKHSMASKMAMQKQQPPQGQPNAIPGQGNGAPGQANGVFPGQQPAVA